MGPINSFIYSKTKPISTGDKRSFTCRIRTGQMSSLNSKYSNTINNSNQYKKPS
jgi:hypothetical protein